jgi:hypothetical protein
VNCIEFETLVAYWLGEVEPEPLEEHLFACASCSARLDWLAALSAGVRAAVRAGALGVAVSAAFVEGMKAGGLRVREYRVAPGERVSCTIRADDDAVVTRMQASLAGVRRLDLARVDAAGGAVQEARMRDIPFDAASGTVYWLPPAAHVRQMPSTTLTLRSRSARRASGRSASTRSSTRPRDAPSGRGGRPPGLLHPGLRHADAPSKRAAYDGRTRHGGFGHAHQRAG